MSARATRNSVRNSPQQPLNKNFVSAGSVQPANIPVVTYQGTVPAAVPATVPAAAPLPPKIEMNESDGDVLMDSADAAKVGLDADEVAKAERRNYWLNVKKTPGVRKKPNKQLVQRRLRKHLTPKNATVALQEVCPGVTYKFATMPGATTPVFTAEVEVSGKQYHGVGSNKSLARAAAAELALQSFVRTPTVTKDDEGKETVEDSTPWSALAGFALHKLFCDWRQGRVGAPLSVESATPPAEDPANAAVAAAAFKSDTPAPGTFQSFSVPSLTVDNKEKRKATPKAAKVLPTDAVSRHPVMLLHEMRPTASFDVVEHMMTQAGGTEGPSYTLAVVVDEQTFQGKARTKKQAKRLAAKAANTAIFGITYPVEME